MSGSRIQSSKPPIRVAVDTGGTFTDCVWVERGGLRVVKVFSTPDDPSQAIVDALSQIAPTANVILLHGTTVGTNTLLQRKGARVAFVTTAGFEDCIEIGRQNRSKLYDLAFERQPPLVERNMRFGVPERVGPEGATFRKPSPDELRVLARDVHASGAEAIAVSTLFSFANADNERAIGRVLDELGLPLSLSHVILPEFREYERASTVVVNAFLQPVMQSYLQRLELRMRQHLPAKDKSSRVFVMQSSGGITSLESASRQPVRTVLSGPAGGVIGAVAVANLCGFNRVITFDMGGTSTDVALVSGDVRPRNGGEIAGFPVRVPTLDIHTVGAGGGSVVRFDAGGALRVGPESAGADPGPICYGQGTQPTVTDANLLLGRLSSQTFLGGTFSLDLERTRAITAEWLNRQNVGFRVEEFAEGVIQVANANMERALRVVSIERGHDPRQFVLVAFGGAAGLHACELAQSLGISRVVIPVSPGTLSAYGILMSDIVKDYSRTVALRMDGDGTLVGIRTHFDALIQRASREFREEGWVGTLHFERSADVRYQGQGFELNIPFTPALLADFHREHKHRYGYDHATRAIEMVTVRLRASIRSPRLAMLARKGTQSRQRNGGDTRVWHGGKQTRVAVFDRESLAVGKKIRGPALITEYSSTTFLPSRSSCLVHPSGNLLITLEKRKAPG